MEEEGKGVIFKDNHIVAVVDYEQDAKLKEKELKYNFPPCRKTTMKFLFGLLLSKQENSLYQSWCFRVEVFKCLIFNCDLVQTKISPTLACSGMY